MTVETKDEKEEENNEEIVLDELMKVCNVFKVDSPSSQQVINILDSYIINKNVKLYFEKIKPKLKLKYFPYIMYTVFPNPKETFEFKEFDGLNLEWMKTIYSKDKVSSIPSIFPNFEIQDGHWNFVIPEHSD